MCKYLLSYNDKFAYSVQDMRTIGEDDGIGSVSFYYLDSGCSYFTKVRSYTIRNNVKVVGPWSEIRKVDLPIYDTKGTTPAKYTYEIYGLDKQKADIYTHCMQTYHCKKDNLRNQHRDLPGKCVITITDIYGQKITSTVSVTQKLYNPHTETSYVVTSETVDSTLPVPAIKSIDYGDGWVDLNCPTTFTLLRMV